MGHIVSSNPYVYENMNKKSMSHPTQHHVNINYTLADRKIRLYAVLAEITIGLGGGIAVSYLGMVLLKDKEIGRTMGGIFIILFAVIQIILVANRSQTIGKNLFGIQVINNKTGKRVGFWRYSILRTLIGGTLVIGTLPIIGWIFQPIYFIVDSLFIFRKDKRTLHDLIGGTSVINLPEHQKTKRLFKFTKL